MARRNAVDAQPTLTGCRIDRAPSRAAREAYDIAIIGGGMYGAMLLLLAASCRLKAILVEQNDFGSGTSFNSLRIIHGGLRFLQSLDIARFRAMVRERAWFLRHFPDLTVPLPCLMPLYGRGLHSRSVLRLALYADRLLSGTVGMDVQTRHVLRPGEIVSRSEVERLFPLVERKGLTGGAVWYDAHVPASQRVLIETLRWAVARGATALNYVEAQALLQDGDSVHGIEAHDKLADRRLAIEARVVMNAAGPESRALAARFDREVASIFRPSLAWNLLLDRPQLSDYALAVAPGKPGAQLYFLLPWSGRILAGTGHAGITAGAQARPAPYHLAGMIGDLNDAVPELRLSAADVAHVFAGKLPVRRDGSVRLTSREVILDHGRHRGPDGLFTVSGVKLVAAREVAEKALKQVCRRFFPGTVVRCPAAEERPPAAEGWNTAARTLVGDDGLRRAGPQLRALVDEESVVHLDDLALRRTTLWEDAAGLERVLPQLCTLFDWNAAAQRTEIARVAKALGRCPDVPQTVRTTQGQHQGE